MKNELFSRVHHLMPLEYHEEILTELKRYSQALDNLTALGTHLLNWELKSISHDGDEGAFVIAFFKRAIDIIDAASILIEYSSIIPAKGLLRILLEIDLQFEYLFIDSDKVRTKVLHLAIMEHHYMLLEAEKVLNEPTAKQYWEKYSIEINQLSSAIGSPVFDFIRDDFESKVYTKLTPRTRKKIPPHWFSLSGGGDSISALFESLRRKHYQREVYSILSETIHSLRLIPSTLHLDADGQAHVKPIRDFAEAKSITTNLCSITLELYSRMLRRRKYEEQGNYLFALQEWKAKYSDLYLR